MMSYSYIVFGFATVNMASLAFEKIFQSVGRMKVTMVALIVGCVGNIILDRCSSLASGRSLPWALQARRWPPVSARH